MNLKQRKVQSSFFYLVAGIVLVDLLLQFFWRRLDWGVANLGISFGAFQKIDVWLLLIVWLGLLFWYSRNRQNIALILILTGGAGNLAARFMMGGVWDYIHVFFLPFWFNLSDVMITGGVIWYLLDGFPPSRRCGRDGSRE